MQNNRRQFIKYSGAVAAGTVINLKNTSNRFDGLLASEKTLINGIEQIDKINIAPLQDPVKITDVKIFQVTSRGEKKFSAIYVEISTDKGLTGLYGPINKEQAFVIVSKLRSILIGKDPLNTETLWDSMRRNDRHGRAGYMMMAISSVDNALWDIRGKYYGVPVYRLLGGPTRNSIRAYASMLGYPVEPEQACKVAREYFDKGFTAQKWFFQYGPAQGSEGYQKNISLIRELRRSLGESAELMFDGKWGWDVPYSISMAKEMIPYHPAWLEEPIHPEQIEGYIRIKRETGIPLASGEHFYTRWNVKQFLDAGALDYVQADPEWTGGVTELVKICSLADVYEVKVVPHGHHILAAAHVVASQPVYLCPMIEYLFQSHLDRMQYFHKKVLRPVNGWLELPTDPGFNIVFDENKIDEKRELKWE